jgi:hypothetical protein
MIPTSTPSNVLATAGAALDIAANTAVVGAWNFCTGDPEPPCGQTAEQAFPRPFPYGAVPLGQAFDAGVNTKNFIDDIPSRPPTQMEKIGSGVALSISIPTSLVPLLIFFFVP